MNTKNIFFMLILLAAAVVQNVGAASAATPLSNLEINASGLAIEIKEVSNRSLNEILLFYARGLSTRNAQLERHPMGVVSMKSDDSLNSNYKAFALAKKEEPREGMICYKDGLGFGIVLSLEKIRARADEDACCNCCCFWANETINQRIVKRTPDNGPKTLVFLFGDRQVHNSFERRS